MTDRTATLAAAAFVRLAARGECPTPPEDPAEAARLIGALAGLTVAALGVAADQLGQPREEFLAGFLDHQLDRKIARDGGET